MKPNLITSMADWQRTIRFFAQLLEFNENLEGIIKDIQNDRG